MMYELIAEEFKTLTPIEQIELLRCLIEIAYEHSDYAESLRETLMLNTIPRLSQRHTMALLLASHRLEDCDIAKQMKIRTQDAQLTVQSALRILGVATVEAAILKLTTSP